MSRSRDEGSAGSSRSLPGMTCVGECGGRDEAVAAIVERQPDVVLLDMQLGRAYGVRDHRGDRGRCDAARGVRHGVRSARVEGLRGARARLRAQAGRSRATARRARARGVAAVAASVGRRWPIGSRACSAERSRRCRHRRRPRRARPERFVVRDGDRLSLLEIEQVDWFESAGNYVRVHSRRPRRISCARRWIAWRSGSPSAPAFIRVRRSAIVNVRAVATLERYGKAAFVVHLRSGDEVISSRYYQPALRRLLREERQ